jgi:hypothetical protein
VTVTGDLVKVPRNAAVAARPFAGKTTTCSLAAAQSAEGRTNLTVAQVGVTDDTVTCVGGANLDMVAAAGDKASGGAGVDATSIQTASTRGAAMTTDAAAQDFFM